MMGQNLLVVENTPQKPKQQKPKQEIKAIGPKNMGQSLKIKMSS